MLPTVRPIAVVDGRGFNKLLTCPEPGYTVPSRTFVMNSLKQRYSILKQKLQESMCARYLAFTTDIWTSRATEAYMTITAHYISDEWKLESMFCVPLKWLKDILVLTLLQEFVKFWRHGIFKIAV